MASFACTKGVTVARRSSIVGGITTANSLRRWAHTVRLIALEDLPHGKGYTGDVVHVKAGYARNYLIPQKMALYATPQNFDRLGIVDPDLLLKQQKRQQQQGRTTPSPRQQEGQQNDDVGTVAAATATAAPANVTEPSSKKAEKLTKEADLLRKYLKNKVLKIWRTVDKSSSTGTALHPGYVTAYNIRQKLSTQLKIDLNVSDEGGRPREYVHIYSINPTPHNEYNDKQLQTMMDEFDITKNASKTNNNNNNNDGDEEQQEVNDVDDDDAAIVPCSLKIRNLGEYVAKITLEGGHSVPLKFVIVPRVA